MGPSSRPFRSSGTLAFVDAARTHPLLDLEAIAAEVAKTSLIAPRHHQPPRASLRSISPSGGGVPIFARRTGGNGLAMSNPVQTRLADVNAVARHVSPLTWPAARDVRSMALGLERADIIEPSCLTAPSGRLDMIVKTRPATRPRLAI